MDNAIKNALWQQYGAAIDMLEDGIQRCPEAVWQAVMWADDEDSRYGQFWFVAYHTVKSIDAYLTGTWEGFAPPAPFLAGQLPEEPYTKPQILSYLQACRDKCQRMIESLTDETAMRTCVFDWMSPSYFELQIYTMRHVQEHAGQLSLFLGQHGVQGMDWISIAGERAA
jgi:uncharacterized damage-inducible protein DinB